MKLQVNNLRTFKYLLTIALFTIILTIAPSISQSEKLNGLILDGQKLAKDLCSKCHAIDKTDNSKNKEAPPLRTFSQKWPLENLEEALAEGIVVGHDDMPEFKFTPDQIASFIAFLEHLQPKDQK